MLHQSLLNSFIDRLFFGILLKIIVNGNIRAVRVKKILLAPEHTFTNIPKKHSSSEHEPKQFTKICEILATYGNRNTK